MTYNPLEKLYMWSPEKILWYSDACMYSGNDRNQKLAAAVISALPQKPHICDIGCGIGSLSLELRKDAGRVTAVDINSMALKFLRNAVNLGGYKNIEVIEGDFTKMTPPSPKADCLVFCMAGGRDFLENAKKWTEDKIIIINELTKRCSFSSKPRSSPKDDGGSRVARLRELCYRYEETVIKTSFGQPFRNFEDAVSFVSCYDREGTRENIERMLDEHLVHTGREDFPLYLPTDKEYSVFILSL